MVLSSRLAKRIGVRRPNVPGGGPRRGGAGPVTDARQVLNARGLRNNLGRGSNPRAFRSTLRSDQLVATAIRGTNTAGPRFPKRQAQVATSGQLAGRVGHVGRVQTRQQGLVSATKRLAHGRVSSSLRLWALGHRSGAGSFSSQRQEDGDGIDDVVSGLGLGCQCQVFSKYLDKEAEQFCALKAWDTDKCHHLISYLAQVRWTSNTMSRENQLCFDNEYAESREDDSHA